MREPYDRETYKLVKPYTMTTEARVFALIDAVRYVHQTRIAGAMVECGVWRGGSMMTVLRTLAHLEVNDREVYLYDTYEGMSDPIDKDGAEVNELHQKHVQKHGGWSIASLEEVQHNIGQCPYPAARIHYVKGKVEDSIPGTIPETISLLRLDTDWYESTRHELEHLFPRLSQGGVLILDDYGAFEGCKRAVDEYFTDNPTRFFFLHCIDDAGRMLIKY